MKKNGWITQFLTNHDSARPVSWFGNDRELRYETATMLALLTHTHPGTVYIYQGEEIGMVNYPFRSVKDFNDLESINAYNELTEKMGWEPGEIFPKIANKSRDNARTPMQWDDSPNAGFTTGKPWLAVNPNYKKINAQEQIGRSDSVFHYYRKLIELRHQYGIIVYGHYDLQLAEDPDLYVYTRELDVKAATSSTGSFRRMKRTSFM